MMNSFGVVNTCYGNGLVATKPIKAGEIILVESPFVWNAFMNIAGNKTSGVELCYNCGTFVNTVSSGACGCLNNCQIKFCSVKCRNEANTHKWLCDSYKEGSTMNVLSGLDVKGHTILAVLIYIKCAILIHNAIQSNTITTSSYTEALDSILETFFCPDYCLTVHAVRTGMLMTNDNPGFAFYESAIAPAYYETRLAPSLILIKSIFANNVMWESLNSNDSASTNSYGTDFTNSDIFSPTNFRRIMGCFAVNNHRIDIQHYSSKQYDANSGTVFNSVGAADKEVLYHIKGIYKYVT